MTVSILDQLQYSRGLTEATKVDRGILFGTSPIVTIMAGASAYFELTIGSRPTAVLYSYTTTGSAIARLRLGHTLSATGTLQTIQNYNLLSPNVTSCQLRVGVTPSNAGTAVVDTLIPGGRGVNSVGGSGSEGRYIIYPAGAVRLIQIENTGISSIDAEFNLGLYEVNGG